MARTQAGRGGAFINAVRIKVGEAGKWPFTIPAIRGFGRRPFHPAVTYLIGENGSGKSTPSRHSQ